jgi:hypothetical protein
MQAVPSFVGLGEAPAAEWRHVMMHLCRSAGRDLEKITLHSACAPAARCSSGLMMMIIVKTLEPARCSQRHEHTHEGGSKVSHRGAGLAREAGVENRSIGR